MAAGVGPFRNGYIACAPDNNGSAGSYVDYSAWIKNVSWPIDNEGGDASGMGTSYRETTPGEKPKEGPITFDFMKSFASGGPDRFFEPLARSGGKFWMKIRNDKAAASATNPEWAGQVHSLSGYMPVTSDEGRTDAARVTCTVEITSKMTRNPA